MEACENEEKHNPNTEISIKENRRKLPIMPPP
jgi:hypothetical protein